MMTTVAVGIHEKPLLELLSGNHPVFFMDSTPGNTVYVYHAFGLHALYLGDVLSTLVAALGVDEDEGDSAINGALSKAKQTTVFNLLSTFSAERRYINY